MKVFGLDIGTTTISAVVAEEGQVIASRTLKNGAFLPTPHAWEKIQDVGIIRSRCLSVLEELLGLYPDICAIGVTGQMHGILYLNREGAPLSPLYTWQDGRGDLICGEGLRYAEKLQQLTGYAAATGYGMVTHYYNQTHHLVPKDASVFCTIHDYIAMTLCGLYRPVTDASDAASLGLFDAARGCFDEDALTRAGISPDLVPDLAAEARIGFYQGKIPVFVAIGDNQASFLGSTGGSTDAMLVNVGTGSQFSAYTREYMTCPGLETRPFPGGGYLLVGAPLCGGQAYALLEGFLRSTAQAMTGNCVGSCYDAMKALLDSGRPEDLPVVTPLFQGTRQDPTLRGSITGLSTENFTPRHLVWAMLEGMTAELYGLYQRYREAGGRELPLMGSGNGLRQNPHLQDCFSRTFGQKVTMSRCIEEAAAGAAFFAAANIK